MCVYTYMCVCVSCSVVFDSLQLHGLQPARLLCPWTSPTKRILVYSFSQSIYYLAMYTKAVDIEIFIWNGQPFPSPGDLLNPVLCQFQYSDSLIISVCVCVCGCGCVCMYVCITESLCYIPETNTNCKSIILQLKF